MRKNLLTLFAVLPLTASLANAQTTASPTDIGLQGYHDYHGGDIDHINLDNGNLTITIPFVSYPQRGSALKTDFSLVFNGTGMTWQKTCTVVNTETICLGKWEPPSWTPGFNPFTTNGGPALYDMQDLASTERSITYSQTVNGVTSTWFYLQDIWDAPDGSSHPAVQTSTGQIAQDGSNIQGNFLYSPYQDPTSTPCQWDCTLPGAAAGSTVMATREGITYFGSDAATTGLIRMDADGNYISSNGSSLTDTTGRVIPFPSAASSPTPAQTASCTGPLTVTSVRTWTPPGYETPFLFCYVTLTLSSPIYRDTGGSISWVEGTSTKTVLQSVILPNGQSWIFEYNESAANCPGESTGITNVGDVTQITFPTGGTINYTYSCNATGTGNPPTSATTVAASRAVNANDGTGSHEWTYTYSGFLSSPNVVTVADPLGNATVQTLTYGSVSGGTNATRATQYYSGTAASGSLLKTDIRSYPPQYAVPFPLENPNGFPLYPTSDSIILNNGMSTVTDYQYCCDISFSAIPSQPSLNTLPAAASYGKVTDTKVYDYTGILLKETATAYLFQSNSNYMNPGFFDLPSSQTTYDGSGNQGAQTTFAYDQTARVVSGIAALTGSQLSTPIYSVFGHQTSQTHWLNTGPSNPVTTTSYYDTGESYRLVDPLDHTTSSYYCTGSSPTSLPCTASTYMGALVTVISNALGQQSSFTYRTDTGQKLTATDPNGQTTTYSYAVPSICSVNSGNTDTLNRLSTITYPDQEWTGICYNDTGTIGVTVTQKITSSLSKVSQANVDGLGREYETGLLSDPSGTTYTRTTYDALGRTYQVWNPTRCNPMTQTTCPSETTWGITAHEYDALGRETLMIPPDGTATSDNIVTSYNGNVTTVTDEAAKPAPRPWMRWAV